MSDMIRDAVYRQCADTDCPAFILELPHSHYEHSESAAVEPAAVGRLLRLPDFSGTLTISPDAIGDEPTLFESPVKAWLSLPLDDDASIMAEVGKYITWIETGLTAEVCKCQRIPHPTKPGVFGGETSLECPAHSKEGLVLGFIEWLKRNGN